MIDAILMKQEITNYLLFKLNYLCDYINTFDFVKSADVIDSEIKIIFDDSIEQGQQNILDVFVRGGVIKKENGEYYEVHPIDSGELR